MQTLFRQFAPLVLAAALAACAPAKIKTAKNPSEPATTKPPSGSSGSAGTDGGNALGDVAGKSLLESKYQVKVTVAGIPVCDGTASLAVSIPATPAPGAAPKSPFDVKCLALTCVLGKKVNVDSLLGGLGSGAAAAPSGKAGIDIDKKYLRLTAAGPAAYQPGLVMLPNILGADRGFLETMSETQSVTLTSSAPPGTFTGTQTMKTEAFNAAWTGHEIDGIGFDKVFQFRIDSSGFDGADKLKSGLFNTLDARMNLSPLALLTLSLTTKVSDLLPLFSEVGKAPPPTGECGTPPPPPAGGGAGILAGLLKGGGGASSGSGSGGLLGAIAGVVAKLVNVTFEITLLEQKGLKEAVAAGKTFDDLKNSQGP